MHLESIPKLYRDTIKWTSVKPSCAFSVGDNLPSPSTRSHVGRKKNFRSVVMLVVCAPVIKFAVAPRPSTGQSSLQNSNLITPAFESATKEKGERERERERREREKSFHLGRARDRITDSTWRRRSLRFLSHEDKLKKRRKQMQFYEASAIVLLPKWETGFSLVSQLSADRFVSFIVSILRILRTLT